MYSRRYFYIFTFTLRAFVRRFYQKRLISICRKRNYNILPSVQWGCSLNQVPSTYNREVKPFPVYKIYKYIYIVYLHINMERLTRGLLWAGWVALLPTERAMFSVIPSASAETTGRRAHVSKQQMGSLRPHLLGVKTRPGDSRSVGVQQKCLFREETSTKRFPS